MSNRNCETEYFNIPLGRTVTAAELQNYMNNLLCTVDQKLHDIALITSRPEDDEKNRIICEINNIRCDLMFLKNQIMALSVDVKHSSNTVKEVNLQVLKNSEKIKVLFDSVNELEKIDVVLENMIKEVDEKLSNANLDFDNKIAEEKHQREVSDTMLSTRIDENKDKALNDLQKVERDFTELVDSEKTLREQSDTMLSGRLDVLEGEFQGVKDSVEETNSTVEQQNEKLVQLQRSIEEEASERVAADNATNLRVSRFGEEVDNRLDSFTNTVTERLDGFQQVAVEAAEGVVEELSEAIAQEVLDRTESAENLQRLITDETNNRISEDTALNNRITESAENLQRLITDETKNRISEDTALNNRINELETSTNDISSKLDVEIENRVEEEHKIIEKVNTITTSLTDVRQSVTENTQEIASQDMRIESLEDEIPALNTRVGSVETKANNNAGKIEAVETQYGTLTSRVTSAEADIRALQEIAGGDELDAIKNNINTIKTTLNKIQQFENIQSLIDGISYHQKNILNFKFKYEPLLKQVLFINENYEEMEGSILYNLGTERCYLKIGINNMPNITKSIVGILKFTIMARNAIDTRSVSSTATIVVKGIGEYNCYFGNFTKNFANIDTYYLTVTGILMSNM